VQTLDGAIYFGMPELISVPKEHLELDCNISQAMEGSICQVDAEALRIEAKGPSLKSLDPLHDGRRCRRRTMA
jgi:HD superfamily phosphodiesterase